MIQVTAHEERMKLPEHLTELRCDALRQENGHPRADAEELDVGYAAKPLQNPLELGIGKEQGIASGKQHIPHFLVLFQVTKGSLKVRLQLLLASATDHATAGAVSAVGGTAVRDE